MQHSLNLKLRIENYTSNRETKDFIVAARMTSGKRPTYGDLVRQNVALNRMPRFERIPQDRYINFVADFLEASKGATRGQAIAAWNELKELDVPKNYASWVTARVNRQGKNSSRRVLGRLRKS